MKHLYKQIYILEACRFIFTEYELAGSHCDARCDNFYVPNSGSIRRRIYTDQFGQAAVF
jgi:hypothetical protein